VFDGRCFVRLDSRVLIMFVARMPSTLAQRPVSIVSPVFAISFPELRSPLPAVGKRELWEHPFSNGNNRTLHIRFQCAVRSLHLWYLWRMPEMDAPRALVFRPLVKVNEALGTRLLCLINHVLTVSPLTSTLACLVTKQCLMVFGSQTFIVCPGP